MSMSITLPAPAFRGWNMVAATHVLFALIFGAMYAFGAFFEALQHSFQADRFSVSAVFAGTAFVYYLMGVVSGALADRFSARWIVSTGIVLLSLGLALASLAPSLPILMALFCGFVGLGVGLVYIPSITVVQHWFVRQRSRASGLALAGTGLGTLAGPVIASALLQRFDWRGTMQWFALGVAVLGLAAASRLIGQPADGGQRPDGDTPASLSASQATTHGMTLPQTLRSTRFWWFFASIFLASLGLFVALVHISPYARAMDIAPTHSSVLIGLIGVGNVLGRLLLGGLGDRLGPQRLLLWLTMCLGLLNLLWFVAGGFWGLAVFALLFGAANGGCIALYPVVAANWFGTRYLGAVLGTPYVGVGIAALFGAGAGGWLFDLTQSYVGSILGSGGAAMLGAGCLVVADRRGLVADARSPSLK
nr:MFS transporter [uncultured Albidiferax sp.]